VINNSSEKVGGSGPRKTHRIYAPEPHAGRGLTIQMLEYRDHSAHVGDAATWVVKLIRATTAITIAALMHAAAPGDRCLRSSIRLSCNWRACAVICGRLVPQLRPANETIRTLSAVFIPGIFRGEFPSPNKKTYNSPTQTAAKFCALNLFLGRDN